MHLQNFLKKLNNQWFLISGAVLIYCLLALAAYWPIFPGDSTRLPGCVCGDTVQSVWFLRWVPFALLHGHNPFFTTWINTPYGANLGQNTLMPMLGLLTAPLTLLVSPVASFNLIAWAAFPLSAGAMFYVVRRLSGTYLAAFIAGLLYGFSPYMVGQAGNHIMLSFIPLPPLIILTVWELLVRQRKQPWRLGIALAVEMVAQFLIEPEVLAITALVILLGGIIIAIARASFLTRNRLIYSAKGLAVATGLTGLCLAYPVWYMIAGPQHFTGPNFVASNPYRSDLYGLVLPTLNEHFVPTAFQQFASRTAGGDYPESGDYIGIVLLLIAIVSLVRWRHNRWLVLSAVLAFLCWVLSLGPHLVANGTITSIPLPFAALVHLPLLQDILPSRLSLPEWLFVSIFIALSITELKRSQTKALSSAAHQRQVMIKSSLVLLATGVFITLLPSWPYLSQPTNIPRAFAASSKIVPTGAIVLAYPLPLYPSDQAMLWQATNGMRFKLLGGYIQNLSPQGTESEFPALLSPPAVQSWLAYEEGVANAPWPPAHDITTHDILTYLSRNNVGAIVIAPDALNGQSVAAAFRSALGPPELSPSLFVWTNVQQHLPAPAP
jgi:hypothetical protein